MIPLKPWLLPVVVVLAIAGVLAGTMALARRDGTRAAQVRALEQRAAVLALTVRQDSSALARRDTVRLFRRIATVDTVLQHILDTATVEHHDTVTVERRVIQEAVDIIRECQGTVHVAGTLARDATQLAAVRDTTLRTMAAAQPGFLRRHVSLSIGYGATADRDGLVHVGPTMAIGWKVWP